MKKITLGIEFFISAFIALIAAIVLLLILVQQEHIDDACSAIERFDQDALVSCAEEVWDIDGYGTRKETMLMTACRVGNTDAVEFLLKEGADPNATVPGKLTPLELFCNNGYEAGEDLLLLLLENGVRQSIYSVKPAIFYLAENFYWMDKNQKAIATEESIWLLQYGAPLGYEDTSLLHLTAKSDMDDLFYTIVHTREGLTMINMENGEGYTPWDVALKNGSIGVQRVIRNLEKEYQDSQEETRPSEPSEETEPPLGSIDNPYPDGYFDETEPSEETEPTDYTMSWEEFEAMYGNGNK